MKELTLEAKIENIERVTAFVNAFADAAGCPARARMQLDVAIDEAFGNIAQYAYGPEGGEATVRVEACSAPKGVVLTLTDSGKPFNPLAGADPDVTLPAHERPEGGLGIYMVKKLMDEVAYAHVGGKNILRIKKTWAARAER